MSDPTQAELIFHRVIGWIGTLVPLVGVIVVIVLLVRRASVARWLILISFVMFLMASSGGQSLLFTALVGDLTDVDRAVEAAGVLAVLRPLFEVLGMSALCWGIWQMVREQSTEKAREAADENE